MSTGDCNYDLYKSSIQERSSPLGAKMGRGSQFANKYVRKLLKCLKQCSSKKDRKRFGYFHLQQLHNIIKRFKESGGISVRKGQGRKPKLNNRDLRSLRWHCIKNRHSSIVISPHGLRTTLANLCQVPQYVVTSTNAS